MACQLYSFHNGQELKSLSCNASCKSSRGQCRAQNVITKRCQSLPWHTNNWDLHEAVSNDTVPQYSTRCVRVTIRVKQCHDTRGAFKVGPPALIVRLVQINQVKFDEEMHGGQCHFTTSRVKGVENFSHVAHSLLLCRQGIDESLLCHKVS